MYDSESDTNNDESIPNPSLTTPLVTRDNVSVGTILQTPWDPRRGKIAGALILGALTLERLAFYSVHSNLYVFLTTGPTPWASEDAISATLLMLGLAYFSAFPAGWIADALIGRFKTIVCGLFLYVIGYTLLTLMAADLLGPLGCNRQKITSCSPHIFSIMVIVGLAVGTVKANIPPFGAEQVRSGGTSSLRVYFNWYYWCINGGSLVGIGALSYIEQDTSGGRGFPVAFAVSTGALALALLLILIGRPIFVVHRPISSSLLGSIFHMFREGVTGCCSTRVPISIQGSPILSHHNAARPNLPERSSRPLTTSSEAPMWLDYAKVRYGGSHRDAAVDEVKKLGTVLLLLVSLLPYWLVFLQSDSGFQAQAVHLKVDVDNFRVPTAWLGLMDQVFVLALIPLMNNLIYPLLDRAGYNVSLVTRIGIGMLLSTFAVSAAGGLETISMNEWKNGHRVNQTIANETYAASEVSVLWQIPQYCLVGSAEVFASVGGLELAHALAPRSLQGLVMGLLSAMEGIASFLGMGLIAILSPVWIQPDITHFSGHLDWFFFLLAILQGTMLVLCTVIVWRRRRREALQSNPVT